MNNINKAPQNLHEIGFSAELASDIAKADVHGNLKDPAYYSEKLQTIAERCFQRGEAPSFAAALAYCDGQMRNFAPGLQPVPRTRLTEENYSEELDRKAEQLLVSGKAADFKDACIMAAQELGAPAPYHPPVRHKPTPSAPPVASTESHSTAGNLSDPVTFRR